MARKFLYVIAAIIVLVLAGLLVLRVWGMELARLAFIPNKDFVALTPVGPEDYAKPAMWYAHPALKDSPVDFWPKGSNAEEERNEAAIFYIHPTTYLNRAQWNAPLDDKEAGERAVQINRMQASVFNTVGQIWSPRYRQATFGSFLAVSVNATKAHEAAYQDILAAFDAFLKANPGDGPIILAGHSQGSRHLLHLLHDKVKGQPVQARLVAAYVVGWPVSVVNDLPALGMPACDKPDATGCVLSWQSWAEPAEMEVNLEAWDASKGLNGKSNAGTAMLCSNPLGSDGSANLNLGTLKMNDEATEGELLKGLVPARCEGRGMLMIGEPVDLGSFVMPGNNFHVYDYSLFWANIRADSLARLAAYSAKP